MRTINAIFKSTDAALAASERARELAGPRAAVRVFLPHGGKNVVEASIVADRSSWPRVAIVSVGLGLAGVVLLAFMNVHYSYALLWFFWAIAGGAMLAEWLTGELFPRHILGMSAAGRSRYEAEIRAGNSVVTVILRSSSAAEQITRLLTDAGGRMSTGFFHENDTHPAVATKAPHTI
jgi:hypothetical protein